LLARTASLQIQRLEGSWVQSANFWFGAFSPWPSPPGEGMAAARIVGTDSLVADPAAGRFRGSRRRLLVGRILTPALSRWERGDPKPSSAQSAAGWQYRGAESLRRAVAMWRHRLVRPLKRLKSRAPAVIARVHRRNAAALL